MKNQHEICKEHQGPCSNNRTLWGSICDDKGLIEHEKRKDGGISTAKDYKAIVRAKVVGCTVVKRATYYRYKELNKKLRTQYSYGQDLYPNSV